MDYYWRCFVHTYEHTQATRIVYTVILLLKGKGKVPPGCLLEEPIIQVTRFSRLLEPTQLIHSHPEPMLPFVPSIIWNFTYSPNGFQALSWPEITTCNPQMREQALWPRSHRDLLNIATIATPCVTLQLFHNSVQNEWIAAAAVNINLIWD